MPWSSKIFVVITQSHNQKFLKRGAGENFLKKVFPRFFYILYNSLALAICLP